VTQVDYLVNVGDLNVVTSSDETCIVDEVSFSLRRGETLGLLGESGSGKTTVALALLGHARRGLRIAGGRVLVDGDDLLAMDAKTLLRLRGSRVAYVPQDPASALNPALRVGTQLREVLRKGEPSGKADGVLGDRLAEVLADVRLADRGVLDAYPHQLSGGQQQRVALAMAFLLRPSVIVLDEPTTGLDVSTQRHILETVRTLCVNYGTAAVFVTHDVSLIGDLADQVAVMYAGRIIELGGAKRLLSGPVHPYSSGLIRAVPSVERSHMLVGLPGQPPRPGARPRGCSFAPRCPHCQPELCTTEPPPLTGLADGHWVRCVRAHDLAGGGNGDAATRLGTRAIGKQPVLTVEGLRASYRETAVLHGVSVEVLEGECLAVVGESGSGKTTLARCLVGLHQRWDGTIAWRDEPLSCSLRSRSREQLRAIQYVFQNPYASLNPRKQISKIVGQPVAQFFRAGARERDERVVDALEAAALSAAFMKLRPGELSGGERQRVAIARALAVRPDVLVCDEVTSSLDVSVQATIVEMLRTLQVEHGLTLIFITHNLALVRSIAHRVAVMHDGQLVEIGETQDVLDHPQAEHTRQLLADLPGLSAGAADHNSTGIPSVRLGADAKDSRTLSTTEGTSSIPS
jgi:peptide/nickel transport system ATP-binding protein